MIDNKDILFTIGTIENIMNFDWAEEMKEVFPEASASEILMHLLDISIERQLENDAYWN